MSVLKLLFIITVLFFWMPVNSFGQAASLSYSYNGGHELELGVVLVDWETSNPHAILPLQVNGPGVSASIQNVKDDIVLGGSLEYYYAAIIVGTKASISYYSNGTSDQWVATPEIGASLFGFASLMYGYRFYLNKNNFLANTHHQISLFILIPVK